MKKYSKLIIAIFIALIFIGTFVFLYQKSQQKPVVYHEYKPTVSDVSKLTVVTGKIEPRNEVNVKPQISGIITEIMKEAGDYVTAGEVIARVKVIPDMSQLSAAESRVRLAQLNLRQAQVDFSREENLFNEKLVSAEEFDKVKQVLKQAREEKNAADDALAVVRDGISKKHTCKVDHLRCHPRHSCESGQFCYPQQHIQRWNDNCKCCEHERFDIPW